jgi:phage terminase large subunit-like protein
VPLVTKLRQDRPEAVVMLDATGGAGSLIEPLEKAGLSVEDGELIIASTRDMTQACGAFYDAVVDSTVRHVDQPVLNLAIGAARWRSVGDARAWTRQGDTDISPLVVATLALAALDREPKKPKKRPGNYW